MYIHTKAHTCPPSLPPHPSTQTIVLPGEERIHRLNHPSCKDKLVTVPPNGARTLYENFYKGVEASGDLPCLGTYSDAEKVVFRSLCFSLSTSPSLMSPYLCVSLPIREFLQRGENGGRPSVFGNVERC